MTILEDSSAEKYRFEVFLNERMTPEWTQNIHVIQRQYFPTAINFDLNKRIILFCASIWIAKLLYAKNPHNNQLIKAFEALKKAAINYRNMKIKSSEFIKYHIAYNLNPKEPNLSNMPDSMPYLELEIKWYELFINGIPKKNGGKRKTLTIMNTLARLVKIAIDGGIELKAPDHNRENDCYGGNLYNFILAIKPLLKIMDIELRADITIGSDLMKIVSRLSKSEIRFNKTGHILATTSLQSCN